MANNEEFISLLESLGRASLHALFPNEVEYYFCALELIDSVGSTVDYLAFPVVPDMSQTNPQITNIRKTAGGIVSLGSSTFIPKSISLNGNFGKKFRILLGGGTDLSFSALNLSASKGVFKKSDIGVLGKRNTFSIRKMVFNPQIKSGYGAIKILQAICDKSTGIDDFGKPYQLYFYNPTLGEEYVVKVIDLTLSQSKDKNMIWSFQLNLRAIAPLEGILTASKVTGSLVLLLAQDNIQKGINMLAANIKKTL